MNLINYGGTKMNKIKTTEAVGHVICHDITQIIKGEKKDVVFRKGHIVTEEDIPVLLSIGKDNLYVWEKKSGTLHENEAAEILSMICKNDYMTTSEAKEGKIELIATTDGLLKIDVKKLAKINSLGEMMIATRHCNFPVKKGDKLAGTRIIPLVIEKKKMDEAVKLAGNKPLMEIIPFKHKKVGIVTTGNEVFYGRIKDTFGPVIRKKLEEYNVEVLGQKILNDDPGLISQAIKDFIKEGAELIICTGGMSVDPDDTTPTAIQNTGAKIVSYGAPVLPGAMFLLAYYNDSLPILGLPGCVMYSKRTIFDLILPRVMADDKITLEDIANFGHGGLCLSCDICSFPNCGFGK
jgi:molybdenum cofactor synthesis domain-containing protein